MKIRHGAIVDNIDTNLCAKFDDDRLRNETALTLGSGFELYENQ